MRARQASGARNRSFNLCSVRYNPLSVVRSAMMSWEIAAGELLTDFLIRAPTRGRPVKSRASLMVLTALPSLASLFSKASCVFVNAAERSVIPVLMCWLGFFFSISMFPFRTVLYKVSKSFAMLVLPSTLDERVRLCCRKLSRSCSSTTAHSGSGGAEAVKVSDVGVVSLGPVSTPLDEVLVMPVRWRG